MQEEAVKRVQFIRGGGGDQHQAFDAFRPFGGKLGCHRAAEGVTQQHDLVVDPQHVERHAQVIEDLRHVVLAGGLIRLSMAAQVEGDDAVLQRELLQLVHPLGSMAAKAVQEDQRVLRSIRRDVNRREAHQRLGGDVHFPAVEFEVNVHCSQFTLVDRRCQFYGIGK